MQFSADMKCLSLPELPATIQERERSNICFTLMHGLSTHQLYTFHLLNPLMQKLETHPDVYTNMHPP